MIHPSSASVDHSTIFFMLSLEILVASLERWTGWITTVGQKKCATYIFILHIIYYIYCMFIYIFIIIILLLLLFIYMCICMHLYIHILGFTWAPTPLTTATAPFPGCGWWCDRRGWLRRAHLGMTVMIMTIRMRRIIMTMVMILVMILYIST